MAFYSERLHKDYKFMLNAPADAVMPAFDDSNWESVTVPHDWAISGEFKEENDCSINSIEADGIIQKIVHSGRTGGLPIVGCGTYRRWIDIPAEDEGKVISLEFDGVMWASEININGMLVASNHFGYKSFSVDITNAVKYGEKNLLAVKASVFEDCSRWYPGAGIFRNVRLVKNNPTHIEYNGVWLRQLRVAKDHAIFECSIEYAGEISAVKAEVLDMDGQTVFEKVMEDYHGIFDCAVQKNRFVDLIKIENHHVWDLDDPYLYTVKLTLLDKAGEPCDHAETRVGVRTAAFSADNGFQLNGRKVRLNGVCNHHDLGMVGAAINKAALRRQLKLMMEMGVNAIRTSHNPPAVELLDLCDEMGLLVMDEFYDEWVIPKVKNGYGNYFAEHAVQDEIEVIKRDRNHPSIILWSIGNEIREQMDPDGWRIARLLAEGVRSADPTRAITAGFNHHDPAVEHCLVDYVDVVGINYKPHDYEKYHELYPNMCLFGSETASCISSRDIYHFPAEVRIDRAIEPDLAVSAYEMVAPPWAYYAEREWSYLDDCPYVAGEFVWTGMDYLGEPTPYYGQWPSRSSYFGIVDLAGIPKNRFYGYKAHWTDDEVLHVFPHWNWEPGQNVPVHCYTSYPCAELFVNGVSQGKKTFEEGPGDNIARYRLMWQDVTFEPGEIRVVAYNADGSFGAEQVIRTAGEPCGLALSVDREALAADGEDMAFITATIVDADGIACPTAANRIEFFAEGAGVVAGSDNGDQRGTEPLTSNGKAALGGKVVAGIRAGETAGKIRVVARVALDDGWMAEAACEIEVK